MNSQTKAIIRGGLFGGIVYALGMAGFDYSDGENFNVWKFIFNLSFFGIFMALMTRYNLRKQAGKQKTEKNNEMPTLCIIYCWLIFLAENPRTLPMLVVFLLF